MCNKAITEQIVRVQDELAKLQNLLQDEPEESIGTNNGFDCLSVTQVHVFPVKDSMSIGNLRGLAQVVLNDQLVIRGLRIMEGLNGLFVGYPVDPFHKGEDFRSIVNPITRQLREHIEACVLEKYQATMEQ